MQHKQSPLIAPVMGAPSVIDSFHYGYPNLGKKIYIQSSLQVTELSGMLVVWKLKQALSRLEQQGLIDGEVILVPMANPVCLNQYQRDITRGRHVSESNNHLNRIYDRLTAEVLQRLDGKLGNDPLLNQKIVKQTLCWETEKVAPQTAYESQQKVLQSLCCDADIILDLYCEHDGITHLYCSRSSWKAIEPLARALQSKVNILLDKVNDFPSDTHIALTWNHLTEHFGERLGEHSCYSAIVAIKGSGDVRHQDSESDVNAILLYLSSIGVLDINESLPKRKAVASVIDDVDSLICSMGGIVVHHLNPGDSVTNNQLISEVIDPLTDQIDEIRATQNGTLFSQTNLRMATAGMLIAQVIAKKTAR